MAANANLHKAKNEKNDEFYTQLSDVAAELKHYKDHFRGKIVFCNCDDPTWSAFWKYFHLNFGKLGLKKLVSTHYDRVAPTYKMEYEGGDDDNIETGVKTPLEGNGDFRDQECLDLLDECDIVVTNPPFSLFREYVRVLMEYGKKFLIIGNKNAVTYKEIFPLIKDDMMWLGCHGWSSDILFLPPDESYIDLSRPSSYKVVDGVKLLRSPSVWFTNLDHARRHEKLVLWKQYTSEEYPRYDNYDAINVDKTAEIPMDYDGVMGVPISFLDKYCPEQFEIVAFRKGDDGKDLVFTREREREFNRTFESLFDSGVGPDYGCEADDLQRRKEQVCSCSDTTEDMRFFAEYICSHPGLIKTALTERERERESRSRRSSSSIQTGYTSCCSMARSRSSGYLSDGVELVRQGEQCAAVCDKECGGQNKWQADVCTHYNSLEAEPVNVFMPFVNGYYGTAIGGCGVAYVNGKKCYSRFFIRKRVL